MKANKHTCPACGFMTLDAPCDWEICPICYWEDDVCYKDGVDSKSSANHGMLLSQAQANFILTGTADLACKHAVRPPSEIDKKDPNWKPLTKALELVSLANQQQ